MVAANLPKDTVRADLKAKRLQSYWLSAAAPLTAGLQDIEDGKCELHDAAKAMQAALLFLGNASQHHAVQHCQAVLQQLNPQLKSLIKDDDFKDAPPLLFGERFASVAKERLETAAVLKKSVTTGKQVFQKSHPQNYSNLGAAGVAITAAKTASRERGAMWREPVHQGLEHLSQRND